MYTRQEATENKDAVFSSFSDITLIKFVMENHNKTFAHCIVFLPGVKTVRLESIKAVQPPKNSEHKNPDRLFLLQTKVFALNGLLEEALEGEAPEERGIEN